MMELSERNRHSRRKAFEEKLKQLAAEANDAKVSLSISMKCKFDSIKIFS